MRRFPSVLVSSALIALPIAAGASEPRPSGPLQSEVPDASRPDARPAAEIVLVLPLASRAAAEPDWLGAGAATFLAEAVRAAGHEVVEPAEREAALHAAGLCCGARLSLASAWHVGRDLGARWVVTGSWEADGELRSFDVVALDVESLEIARQAARRGPLDELPGVLGRLSIDLVGADAGRSGRKAIEALAEVPAEALSAWMQAAAEPEGAVEHLEAAVDAAPRFVAARLALAGALLEEGELEDVGRLLLAVPRDAPPHQRALAARVEGRLHLGFGDAAAAVQALERAVGIRADVDGLLWLAEARLATGDEAGAAAAARRALVLRPGDTLAADLVERAEARSPADPAS